VRPVEDSVDEMLGLYERLQRRRSKQNAKGAI
jgi:hypothetical protein